MIRGMTIARAIRECKTLRLNTGLLGHASAGEGRSGQ